MDEDTRKDGSIAAAFGKLVIEQIEHGEASPTLDTLRQLAGGLELLLSDLFEGLDDERIASKPFGPLVQLRERRGWSREQLAASSGLDVTMIEQIELEQLSPPLDIVRLIAAAFDLQLSDLLEDR